MRIAFLTHMFPPSVGGMQKWNHQMAQAYAKAGHSVTVFHYRIGKEPLPADTFKYVPINLLPKLNPADCPPQRNTLLTALKTTFSFIRILPELFTYDTWQVTFGEPQLLKILTILTARIVRIPLIVTSGCVVFTHPYRPGIETRVKHALARFMLQSAKQIFVDGFDLQKEFQDHGIDKSRISVCHAGVDTDQFKPTGTRDEFFDYLKNKGISLDPALPVVFYCSRFSPENAPGDFLKSVDGLSDVQAVLVGDGILREQLEKDAKSVSVPVHFTGSVPYADLPLLFSHADICLYTYTHDIGGISQIIPLSMACGAAVITTDIGDNSALITNGTDAYLVKEHDTTEMTRLLTQLLDNPDQRSTLGSAARKAIQESWSLDARDKEYAVKIDQLTLESHV